MPIKRLARHATKKVVRKRRDPAVAAFCRGYDIMESLYGRAKTKARKKEVLEQMAQHVSCVHDHLFLRIRQCIEKAKKLGTWDFMKGCYSQAVEIYAVAAIAYEKFDSPLMPDSMFDELAGFLLKNYEAITDFCKQTWQLDKGIFRAGTGSHFHKVEDFPDLLPYYNRLQAHYELEAKQRERIRTKNKPRLLRKAPHGGQSNRKGGLRRPTRRA